MNEKLRILDLFSGIGGFSLGLEATGGFETVAFCEIEEYPRKVLAKHWPDVPVFNDVRTLTYDTLKEAADRPIIDVITGGYPCQPFSNAGKRRGAEDDRHLWPEMHRLVASVRPSWVIAENVAGHINMGLDQVLSDLEGEGYTCWPLVIPACGVDAPHRRDRVWIVANAGHGRGRNIGPSERGKGHKAKRAADTGAFGGPSEQRETVADTANPNDPPCPNKKGREPRELRGGGRGINVPNPNGAGPHGRQSPLLPGWETTAGHSGPGSRWLPEPPVGRVAHGIPSRVDRLKCLGNSIVPQIATQIGYAILQAEEMNATE